MVNRKEHMTCDIYHVEKVRWQLSWHFGSRLCSNGASVRRVNGLWYGHIPMYSVSFTLVLSPRSWLGYFHIHIRFHLLRMPFLELLGKAIWYPSSLHIWIFSITFLTALVLTWKSNPTVDAWPPALITSRLPTACLHPFWASQIYVRFAQGTPLLFYFVLPHFKLFG